MQYLPVIFGVDLEEFAQRPESYRLTDDLREQELKLLAAEPARNPIPSRTSLLRCSLTPRQSLRGMRSPEFDLDDYTRHGERFTHIRDPYIDFRRETAMAARLKFLLSRYKRVLFVGGLAHWTSITGLLGDDAVRPAELLIRNSKPPGKRVIIHPSMAVNYMDHFPVMSTLYEAWRAAASGGEKEPFPMAGKVDNLMDIGQPWASSSMFPQYPVISSQRSGVRLFPAEPGERPLQQHFTEWKWKDEAKALPEKNTHWSLLIAGSGIREHIVNGKNYEETVRKFGRYFISSISMIHDSDVPGEMTPCVNSFSLLDGICLFGNPWR